MNFLKLYSTRFQDSWDLPALTCYETGLTLTYGSLAGRMLRIHILLEDIGARQGSRIAVIGRNSIDWVTVYMAGLAYGATMITLPSTLDIEEIFALTGEARAEFLFIDPELYPGDELLRMMPHMQLVISMDTQRIIAHRPYGVCDPEGILGNLDVQFINRYPYGFHPEHAISPDIEPDAILAIFYTAGTTGRPKGVMLMADNLEGNVIHGIKSGMMPSGWTTVYNILVPLASGAHITILRDVDNRKSLVRAMRKVKPGKLILPPRKMGWLYQKGYAYAQKHGWLRTIAFKVPFKPLNRLAIHYAINKISGGKCEEFIIIGYALGPSLTKKLDWAGIPYTQTYGLVECGGLISYTPASSFKSGTSGRALRNTVKCRLRPLDMEGLPEKAGFLEISGMTVMKGYTDSKLTEQAFTIDHWLNTGDIATIDSHGDIKIIARRNTIIMNKGYAVVPEKLALMLVDTPFISQAIVVLRDGCLTAIVEPDINEINRQLGEGTDPVVAVENTVSEINRITALPERIENVEVSLTPLHKTSKHTIARYRYMDINPDDRRSLYK